MEHFHSAREAKEFLVAQITEEAQREGVSLSDVERKMLYFTETGWTLPDMMKVNDQFDRDYDQEEYEKKIARIIRGATKRTRKENPGEYDRWLQAVHKLRKEDHYILVMCGLAGFPAGSRDTGWKSSGVGIGLICGLVFAVLSLIGSHFGLWVPRPGRQFGTYTTNLRVDQIMGYALVGGMAFVVLLWVLRYVDRKGRVLQMFSRCLSKTRDLFRAPAKRRSPIDRG